MLGVASELCQWALHFAPLLVLLLLLLTGRYPGERVLARLRRRNGTGRHRPPVRLRPRLELVLTDRFAGVWELAVRPPPLSA